MPRKFFNFYRRLHVSLKQQKVLSIATANTKGLNHSISKGKDRK